VRVRLLSRASALARLQTALVERALRQAHPAVEIECLTKIAAGDQDQTSPLWKLPDKGAFTADLSAALERGEADMVVHSFKDLPIDMPGATRIAGALPRADARDVLLVKRASINERPQRLVVLSSSPRRAWLLSEVLPSLLPWPIDSVDAVPVRGNIETRVRKLIEGSEHGLVVAKAALDRLLGFGAPFDREAAVLRGYLESCAWMAMPMREFPWAPAQGAIAIEVARSRQQWDALLEPIICSSTTEAVNEERKVLADHGGGCHQALGAAVIDRRYGRVMSIRERTRGTATWTIAGPRPSFPRAAADRVWPAPGTPLAATRLALSVSPPRAGGWWIARAEALLDQRVIPEGAIVWAAGSQTWRRLARRGIWVHGCADGLGDEETPAVDQLAGRRVDWVRLTHDGSPAANAIATYRVDLPLPDDLASRSHFFWTSGELFKRAIGRWPEIRGGWHASGPGLTHDAISAELGSSDRTGVWLDRESWERDVCA
jgi:hydroxymethylbilane synthase